MQAETDLSEFDLAAAPEIPRRMGARCQERRTAQAGTGWHRGRYHHWPHEYAKDSMNSRDNNQLDMYRDDEHTEITVSLLF